jgi:hypothetical protein
METMRLLLCNGMTERIIFGVCGIEIFIEAMEVVPTLKIP